VVCLCVFVGYLGVVCMSVWCEMCVCYRFLCVWLLFVCGVCANVCMVIV